MDDLDPPARSAPRAVRSGVAIALVLAAVATGCATVRRAREAQDDSRAAPGERTPTSDELGLASSGALDLQDALHAALVAHPSVVAARHDEAAARARVGEAEGAFWPDLSANGSYDYRDAQSRGAPIAHHFTSFGLQLSWLLFDFGRTSAAARQAADQWLAAQADAATAEIDVAFGVRSAYFTLLKDQRLEDVARDAVAQFQEHYDQVSSFVSVGTRIPYDATKADLDLQNARLALVEAEDATLSAQATLANSIGLAETTTWKPVAESEPPAELADFDACWEEARANRPTLAAVRARQEAASELVNARIAALFPSLSLGASASESGSRTPLGWSWSAGPGLSWVPFDGFTNLYSIDEAAALLRAARSSTALAEQRAWLDVRQAWLAARDARRRLDVTALVVASAEENVTLAQGRFDVGRGTSIELTDARVALTTARADAVRARADLDVAIAALERAMGRRELGAGSDQGGRP